MQQNNLMQLKVLLPFRIFVESADVARIVADTKDGSFGLLPNRLDCVAAIAPGIFTYEQEGKEETYLAVDEGVLVKTGLQVVLSVRNAIAGNDLALLRQAVDREFVTLNQEEKSVRSLMAKMESSFISRLARFHHE
jgi:F-type H+-transporting ATPase subunit epsilon